MTKDKSDHNKFKHKKPESNVETDIDSSFDPSFDPNFDDMGLNDNIYNEPSAESGPQDNISAEQNTIETLKQQLEVLKQKADKNWDLAVRAKAELDNVRKRAETDVSNAHKYALDRFIPELFPLLDGLEQGLQSVSQDSSFDAVREGLNLTIKMFHDMLVKFGIEIVDPINKPFDPAMHEAITMQPVDVSADPANEIANGTILIVVQKGYLLHKRVLRPARVVVAKK